MGSRQQCFVGQYQPVLSLVASMLLAGFASSSIVGGGAPRSFPLSRSHSTIQYMLTCAIAMTSSHFFRPMVSGVVTQLARGTDWGVLDVLVIDMPTGTGDIHITMGQQVEMTAAVVRKVNCVASRGHCWWHSTPLRSSSVFSFGVAPHRLFANSRTLLVALRPCPSPIRVGPPAPPLPSSRGSALL